MKEKQGKGCRGVDKESSSTERRQGHLSRSLKGVGSEMSRCWRRVSRVEGTASPKVLRQVLALCTCARGKGVPLWLEWGNEGSACRCGHKGQ